MRPATCLLMVLLAWGVVRGRTQATESINHDLLTESVRQLFADDFQTRLRARERLLDAGAAAVPPLQAAAIARPDDATACVQLLDKLSRSRDDAASQAATAALYELAYSEVHSLAQLVRGLRRPELPLSDADQQRIVPLTMSPIVGRIVNGNRETQFAEGERSIEIVEAPTGYVMVVLRTTVDGVETHATYDGAHQGMLRLKNEDAFQIYLRHKRRMNELGPCLWSLQRLDPQGSTTNVRTAVTPTHRQIRVVVKDEQLDVVEGYRSEIEVRRLTLVNGDEVYREAKAKDLKTLESQDPELAAAYLRAIAQTAEGASWQPFLP